MGTTPGYSSCFEQTQEKTSHKAAIVRPFISSLHKPSRKDKQYMKGTSKCGIINDLQILTHGLTAIG